MDRKQCKYEKKYAFLVTSVDLMISLNSFVCVKIVYNFVKIRKCHGHFEIRNQKYFGQSK